MRLDEDDTGVADRTAIGAMNAAEDAMRAAAVARNICAEVDIILMDRCVDELRGLLCRRRCA